MATEDLIRTLAGDLTPVRRLRRAGARTALWAGFALLWVSAAIFAWGARGDLSLKIRDAAWLRDSAVLLFLSLSSARSAFDLAVPGAGRAILARSLAIAALCAWAFSLATDRSSAIAQPAGWPCVLRIAALAVVPGFALFRMLRKAAPLDPGWAGWCALLSAGSLAAAGTQMLCARDDPGHVFLWHLGPLLAAALLGVHIGRRILAFERNL